MLTIKKLASQTAIYGISSIVGRLINYLLVPMYVRTLSVYDNGVLTDFYALVTFLIVLYTYGLETTFFRFANKDELQEDVIYGTCVKTLVVSSLTLSAITILLAQPIANLMLYPEHPEYIIYFAIILALDAMASLPFARLRQQNRPVKFVTYKLINIGANVFFNLYFLVVCPWIAQHYPDSPLVWFYDRNIGVGYVFIANLIASVITILFLLPELLQGLGKFDKPLLSKMIRYSMPLMFAGLAGMTNESFSRIILKYELPHSLIENTRQLGVFGQCFKLAVFMLLAVQAFRMASEPFFFSISKEKRAPEMYSKIMNYFMAVCCFIFLGVTLYLDILKHILSPAYFQGLGIVPVILMAYLFLGVYQNLSIWFKLADQTKFGLYFTVFGAIVTISLNYLLIPIYGYLGSAYATLTCYFLMAILCYLIGQQYYKVPYNLLKICMYLIFTLVLYALGNIIRLFVFDSGTVAWFLSMSFLIGLFLFIVFLIEKRTLIPYVKRADH